VDFFAVDEQPAPVGLVNAGEDLDEARLAGAVAPRRQVTSPASTYAEMSCSAMTLP
jgi:hypothetical protein